MTTEFDAAVVGGGVMGLASALALTRRGVATVLLERGVPGHDRGGSHGDGRIIRYTYSEPVYVELARRAFVAWRELEREAGTTLVERTGGLECGPAGCEQLVGLATTLDAAGIPYERLDASGVTRRFPQIRLPAGGEALYQEDGGVVRAARAVETLARLARDAGVVVETEATVASIEPLTSGADGDEDGVELSLEGGARLRASRLVLAAGAWTGDLLRALGVELPLYATAEHVAYFPPRAGAPSHDVGELPTVIDYHDGDTPFYVLPRIDVAGVKVGHHRTGATIDPEDERVLDPARVDELAAYVGRTFPHLETTPIHATTCLYANTPDHDFVLDRHPSHPHIAFGTGFSGHGFKFAPVIGEILAALALGEDAAPPELALARFAAPASPARRSLCR